MAADLIATPVGAAGGHAEGVGERQIRIFVSSPFDAKFERQRVDRVVERLNGQFAGIARLETVRWERSFYKAHETFQAQIPEAADCDIVIGILRHRLGMELPDDFRKMPNGEAYPSGTAYEILTAMEMAGKRGTPDLYVFRNPDPPTVAIDDAENNAAVAEQWHKLKAFFARWFLTEKGQFKASYQEFRTTDQFEGQVENLLRKWLEEKILKGRPTVWPVETRGSPFRGLAAFGARHAAVFFGRGRDIERSLDALKDASERGAPFMLVVGASGSGKSSLVKAGLVPRLTTPGVVRAVDVWRVALLRPGEASEDPIGTLATRLFDGPEAVEDDDKGRPYALPELAAGDQPTPEHLKALLGHADETAAGAVMAALDKVARAEAAANGHDRPLRADLVIVVDQLDNLFGPNIPDDARARFAKLLSALVATGRIWVIATLRADLYDRFLREPRLLDLKSRGAAYDLSPPGAAELAEIVRKPAAAADLYFDIDADGRGLDERLLADADRPDMLPLLQFTLDQLFDGRTVVDGRMMLTFGAYEALGGMAGAIDRQAERSLAGLPSDVEARLPRLIRQLAEPERGTGALSIRAVAMDEAAYDGPSERLVDALVDARILLSLNDGSRTVVKLAHQRVLENWTRARAIVAENIGFYRIRGEVEDQRLRWVASGRKPDLLIPRGIPLAEAESVVTEHADELPAGTRAFIAASGRKARARQRLVVAAAAVFAVIAAVAVWQTLQAEERRQQAVAAGNEAVTAQLAAEAAEATAISAQTAAEAARTVAEANFAAALTTISDLTDEVSERLRIQEGVRVESIITLLEGIEASIARLAGAAPDNLLLGHARARVVHQFALAYHALGNTDAAVIAAAEGLTLSRRLAEAEPDNFSWQGNVPIALHLMGSLQDNSGQLEAALASMAEAIAISRMLVAERPDAVDQRSELSGELSSQAAFLLEAGELAAARGAATEAEAIARDLLAAAPASEEYRRVLAVALSMRSAAEYLGGDLAAAAVTQEEATALSRELVAGTPKNTLFAYDLVGDLQALADLRTAAGNREDAAVLLDEAVFYMRQLTASDPSHELWSHGMLLLLLHQSDIEVAIGNPAAAGSAIDEAIALARDRLERTTPQSARILRDLSLALDSRAILLLSETLGLSEPQKAFQESLDIARRLVAMDPDDIDRQKDLVIGLFHSAVVERGETQLALIAEGLALARDLADRGLLAPDELVWIDEFNAIVPEAAPIVPVNTKPAALAPVEPSPAPAP